MKLISVIVPVYKVEKFLNTCLNSILKQTYTNFELILVDDGSPDNSGQICDEFAKKDSRIKVIHQKNGGLSVARNSAINVAKGDYLTFIDSDDFIFSEYLEKLVNACETYCADIAVCGTIRCSSTDSLETVQTHPSSCACVSFGDDRMHEFFVSDKITTMACSKLYNRTIFQHLRFPIGKYNEDIFTTYLAIDKANKVVVCDYAGYIYRVNENSIINESFSKRKLDSIEASIIRAKFIELKYPELTSLAHREIVYNCNRVLMSMGQSSVFDQAIFDELQKLYRQYLGSYLLKRSSLFGKLFALMAFCNVKIPFFLVKFFRF